jgi:[ribosomal protein S5]-alanine N-acetyltransferase
MLTLPPFSHLALRTPRLLLRPLQAADAPDLFAMHADPQVMRYWSSLPWTDVQRAHDLIAQDQMNLAAGSHLRLAIERQQDTRFIGTCSLFSINAQCHRAELGYALTAAAWGQGFMQEALQALLRFAFTDLQLNRIEADIDSRNGASERQLLRLGFQREGFAPERWIVGDEVSDSILYGLLRRQWQQDAGAA